MTAQNQFKRFAHTALWQILSDTTLTPTPDEVERAIEEFEVEIHDYCSSEHDLIHRLQILRLTHSGLVMLARKRQHHGAGEKCA